MGGGGAGNRGRQLVSEDGGGKRSRGDGGEEGMEERADVAV